LRAKRLHLGCFDQPVDGWTNTDVTPHLFLAHVPGAARVLHRLGRLSDHRFEQHCRGTFGQVRYLNVGKPFRVADNSVEAIFSSHMLEHLPPRVAHACIQESYRVLQPGGVFRVGVPDLDLWVSQYDRNNPTPFVSAVFETLENSGKNRHYWMYNESSLVRTLLDVGFSSASRQTYQHGLCPDLKRLDNRPDETLFVEAIK
jgi:predicted SAM-dependent methyltransferase